MRGKISLSLLVFVVALGLVNANLQDLVQGVKKFADGIPGLKHAGTASRGRGCDVNWSYEGMLVGFKWKYMGICTDSCTGETMTSFTESKGGAVEHCFNNLMQKLRERNEL